MGRGVEKVSRKCQLLRCLGQTPCFGFPSPLKMFPAPWSITNAMLQNCHLNHRVEIIVLYFPEPFCVGKQQNRRSNAQVCGCVRRNKTQLNYYIYDQRGFPPCCVITALMIIRFFFHLGNFISLPTNIMILSTAPLFFLHTQDSDEVINISS